MSQQPSVYIIGAGVAGLVAAHHLEEKGLHVSILEADKAPGGRVQTDLQDGFLLDRGFQVLLTAYKEVDRYLDKNALELRHFKTGALIYEGGRTFRIADPLRDPHQFLPMLTSPVGTIRDKIRIWQLAEELKKKQAQDLFVRNDLPTLEYLQDRGFSKKMLERFFRPFFGGIFLENELRTPASMFRFVFKMFSEGEAAIPRKGMGAIGLQLTSGLKKTSIRYGTSVSGITDGQIHLNGGECIPFEKVLIATDPHRLLPGLQGQKLAFSSTTNLYFKAEKAPIQAALIALVADSDNPINSFCELSAVSEDYAPPGQNLISVSLKEGPVSGDVQNQTRAALAHLTGLPESNYEFIRMYTIPRALPALDDVHYDIQPTQLRLTEKIYTAGDYLLNGSLDAAMRSGRRAAEAILNS